MRKFITLSAEAILGMLAFALSLWAFGVLSHDGPGVWIAALAMVGLLIAMIRLKFHRGAWALLLIERHS